MINFNESIEFLNSTNKKCAYMPILYYEIIKFTSLNLDFSEIDIVNGFKHFYFFRKYSSLQLDKIPCNPLQDGTFTSILHILNKNPENHHLPRPSDMPHHYPIPN